MIFYNMIDVIEKFNLYLLTEKRASTNTVQAYKRDLKQFHEFCKRYRCDPSTITVELLKIFFKEMYDNGLSSSTRARKISAIKSFMIYTVGDEHEIIEHLEQPKLEKKLPIYLSETEMKKFMHVAGRQKGIHALRNKLIIYLLYATGMRVSELTSLKLKNMDMQSRMIVVDGKGGKQRMIPLINNLIPFIKEYQKKYHGQFNENNKCNEWLFPVRHHGNVAPMTRQNVMVVVKNIFKKTNILKNISPHSLRHTFATHMINRGANLRYLQLLLGHDHVTSTELYTHLNLKNIKKIYNKKHPRAYIWLLIFITPYEHQFPINLQITTNMVTNIAEKKIRLYQ